MHNYLRLFVRMKAARQKYRQKPRDRTTLHRFKLRTGFKNVLSRDFKTICESVSAIGIACSKIIILSKLND